MTCSITLPRQDAQMVLEVMEAEPGITAHGEELRDQLRRLLSDPNTNEVVISASGKGAAELLGLGIDYIRTTS